MRSTCCARSRAAEPLADRAACAVRAPIRDIPRSPMRPPPPSGGRIPPGTGYRSTRDSQNEILLRTAVAVAVAVRRSRERRARRCWWRFARGSTGSIASRNRRVPSAVARRRIGAVPSRLFSGTLTRTVTAKENRQSTRPATSQASASRRAASRCNAVAATVAMGVPRNTRRNRPLTMLRLMARNTVTYERSSTRRRPGTTPQLKAKYTPARSPLPTVAATSTASGIPFMMSSRVDQAAVRPAIVSSIGVSTRTARSPRGASRPRS